MTDKSKYECRQRNAWGNVCSLPQGHKGRHDDGDYQWPQKTENDAIRAWFKEPDRG